MRRPSIAISGAGIAGLACALGLARAGFQATVLERAQRPTPEGAGIQLSPNAMHALRWLGADRIVQSTACVPQRIALADGRSGRRLSTFLLGRTIAERHGAPYLVAPRATLRDTLLSRVRDQTSVDVRFGVAVQDAASHDDGVTLLLNGATERFDAWIGADGIGSFAREHVSGAARSVDTGLVAWRAIVAADALENVENTALWLGLDAHVVAYAIDDERANVVAVLPSGAKPPDALNRWTALDGLLESAADWTRWPIGEVPVTEHAVWVDRRIALVGDAAHATVPFAAQGAAMALEDAAVMARACQTRPDDPAQAFRSFQDARRNRVRRVARLARNNRRLYHMAPPMVWARDLGMRLAPQGVLQARMDWVYGWRPDGP